ILFNALDDALCSGFRGGSRHAIETLQRFGSARRVGKPGAKTRVARNVGDHTAGMDQRKPDWAPGCFEFVPQTLGKPTYREFCRRIGSLAWRRDDAEDTRNIDNVGLALPFKMRQERSCGMYDAPEIHVHQPVHLLLVYLVKFSYQRHAGIVDEYVDIGMIKNCLLRKVLDLIGLRDIDDMGRNLLWTGPGDFSGDRQQSCFIAVTERQFAVPFREFQRQRATDAARCSGQGDDRSTNRGHSLLQRRIALLADCICSITAAHSDGLRRRRNLLPDANEARNWQIIVRSAPRPDQPAELRPSRPSREGLG